MTGIELDAAMRVIMLRVTRYTIISATHEMVALGFSPRIAYQTLEACVTNKERK